MQNKYREIDNKELNILPLSSIPPVWASTFGDWAYDYLWPSDNPKLYRPL